MPNVFPDDILARLRALEQVVAALTGGSDSLWTFDGTTLTPVTAPSEFVVEPDNGTQTHRLRTQFDQFAFSTELDADPSNVALVTTSVPSANDAITIVGAQTAAGGFAQITAASDGPGTKNTIALNVDQPPDDTHVAMLLDSEAAFSLLLSDATTAAGLVGTLTEADLYWSDGVNENHVVADVNGARFNASSGITSSTTFIEANADGSFSLTADDGTNPVAIKGNDVTGLLSHVGKLGTDQTASATVAVGVLAAKLPIYDNTNTLVGYVPIYATIT